jgi:hypothetical protein
MDQLVTPEPPVEELEHDMKIIPIEAAVTSIHNAIVVVRFMVFSSQML